MEWNDKGGGPWGPPPGGNDPRSRPPNNGGRPPDFEKILRRGQDRMRDLWPNGVGNGRTGAMVVVALALLAWIATGVYRVEPNEEAVIQRFGAWVRTESLGLHYHLPAPIESMTKVDVTSRKQTEIGARLGRQSLDASTMLTGDRNIIELDFVVVWQVRDAVKYLFKVSEPAAVLQRAAESAMREVIGQTDVQPALNEGRRAIELASAAILQTTLDRYDSGIQVAAVQLQKVDPPNPVVDAFNDVQRARSELEQQRNEAEKYRNDIIPRARGEAQKTIQDAEGYKQQVVALATGEAQKFLSILESYKLSRDVTARRMYIETMESILQRSKKMILEPSVDGKGGVVPYLPLPSFSSPVKTAP